jgi:glycosyltransferase involved in cell wall biosynthesis
MVKKISTCCLLIAGSSDYDVYFRETNDICSKVIFTGFLDKKELYKLYLLSDIDVIPSLLYKPFGLIALEMMAVELPVIATATSGLKVVDDSYGLKIPVILNKHGAEVDSELLAKEIVYLLEHPNDAKKMGKNARNCYKKKFSSEIFRDNMLKFYSSFNLYE